VDALKDDYKEIKEEIKAYLIFIKNSGKEGVIFKHKNGKTFILPDSTNKVFKAAFFLLLYNLVEATVRKSILAIYDSIGKEKLGYQDLSEEVQRVWIQSNQSAIKDLKNKNFAAEMHNKIQPLILNSQIFLSVSYVKDSMAGNLNSKQIKELCFNYGISIVRESKELDDIKARRNQLAHGELSFTEVGREYAVQDLEDIYKSAVRHLDTVVKKIENYISQKKYKKTT
jgi:hypothetical protein